MNIALSFDIDTWLIGAILGFARLAPIFFVLPFLNSGVLAGLPRHATIMIVSMGFWSVPMQAMVKIDTLVYLAAIGQELVIGLILACLLAWPFWVFHAIGSLIDNQRGATLSNTIDPANGVDTSEMANFLNLFAAVVYLQGGGLMLFVQAVQTSYELCDPLAGCQFVRTPLFSIIGDLVGKAVLLASPIVVVMLLSEFTLGLLGRFAPQLNAFSISLAIKSAIALSILLLYFAPILPNEIFQLSLKTSEQSYWFYHLLSTGR